MKTLSLFDGISCARVAIERAGIPVESYYASEIDRYAIQVSHKNWPDIVQLGGVIGLTKWTPKDKQLDDIDLLIGGSPCQDLSIAKAGRKGLEGERSGLFYEYVRIRDEFKPKYFILENVASMSKESKDRISEMLGVQPVMINAALVSAQNRKRLFWVGKLVDGKYEQVDVELPEDKGIFLKDILESGSCVPSTYYKENVKSLEKRKKIGLYAIDKHGKEKLKSNTLRTSGMGSGIDDKHNWDTLRIVQKARGFNKGGEFAEKSPTLTSNSFEHNNHLTDGTIIRKLTPVECERLQGLPDNYTEGISNTQRYKTLGNAFNADVIAHILSFLKE